MRDLAHLLWAILRVECHGDGLNMQFEPIWVNIDKRSCQKGSILRFLIFENKDVFRMQNVPKNPIVQFVFMYIGWKSHTNPTQSHTVPQVSHKFACHMIALERVFRIMFLNLGLNNAFELQRS